MQFSQRLGARLGLGFGVVLVLMMAMVGLALERLGHVGGLSGRVMEHEWQSARAVADLNAYTRANARRTMELFFRDTPAERDAVRKFIAHNKGKVTEALAVLQREATDPVAQALLAEVVQARGRYVKSFSRVDELLTAGDVDAARALLMSETLPAIDALQAPVVKLVERQDQVVGASAAAIAAALPLARWSLVGLGAAALLAGVAIAVALTRSVTRPVAEAVRLAEAVAAGDLCQRIDVTRQDELGALQRALQRMNDGLVGIVGRVRASSDSIATGSTQIAMGNADLSQRTEEQASNLQQTAASMEQLTTTVAAAADNARQAQRAAAAASAAAQEGGQTVLEVVDTMHQISRSADRIHEIVGVMDGLSFQTNLLALNAAVEAARAGEQGRGFAVVAGEVRALAQRSAAAAKEVKQLIGESNERVEAGARRAEQAGASMQRIVAQFREVDALVAAISTVAAEQSSGLSQVGDAVSQLDQVTQQNAALVEESAAAAESLRHQAHQLTEVVQQFRLEAVA